VSDEASRIRAEYARRRREIPRDFYARWHPANLFFRHGQERAVHGALRRLDWLPLGERRVLEVGCGDAEFLSIFPLFGATPARLAGIDLDEMRVQAAQQRFPAADLRTGNATSLPWTDGSFDLVVQSTVFSSILDLAMRRAVAREMLRVLSAGGAILWYDFFVDNPRNRSVRGVTRGEIASLFPGCRIEARRVTLAPPLARWLVPRLPSLGVLLESMRVLCTHLIALAVPEAPSR